tara:strand:- start:7890 stop:8486 length:597 start_codon:yes stop_codon:yes gene_type:complete
MTRARDKATLAPSPTGKQTIWIPASAMQPTTSLPCDPLATVELATYKPEVVTLDFPNSGNYTFAQFNVAFPKAWDAGPLQGSLTFQVYWSANNTSTAGVEFGLQSVSVGNNEDIDATYSGFVYVSDNHQGTANKLNITSESVALIPNNIINVAQSITDDSLLFFRFTRRSQASNDTLAAPCRVHGIKLFFTTDAGNDE